MESTSRVLTFRLDKGLHDRIRLFAYSEHRTMGNAICALVFCHVAGNEYIIADRLREKILAIEDNSEPSKITFRMSEDLLSLMMHANKKSINATLTDIVESFFEADSAACTA